MILVGVSRRGKTPTSLYLAMQFGIKAANYPLIPEDFERSELPSALPAAQGQDVRPVDRARAPGGDPPRAPARTAATPRWRTAATKSPRRSSMMRREGIRWLSSTTKSIEEIATTILQEVKLERRDY